jgi:hypothetical protein
MATMQMAAMQYLRRGSGDTLLVLAILRAIPPIGELD